MRKMYLFVVLMLVLGVMLTGCATVPLSDGEVTIPTEESLSIRPAESRVEQDTVGEADVTIVTEENLNSKSVYNND